MTRYARVVPVALALWAPLLTGAEVLTIERALALAEANHPRLRVAAAQGEMAAAMVLTARAYPNPESGVMAGHQHARMLGAPPGADMIYSFNQPLETRGVRQTRIQTAEIGREASPFIQAEARLAVRTAVRQAFYLVLRRRAEASLAQENLKLVEDLRQRIAAQVGVGESPRLELTRADAEVAIGRAQLNAAQLRQAQAMTALRAAVAAPLDDAGEPRGELSAALQLPELAALRSEALGAYPALAAARVEVRRAESQLRYEGALKKPQPTLRSEVETQPDLATYRIGVSLPLPLWQRRQGPIAEATAALRQAREAESLLRLEIGSALESAYARYQQASQQMELLNDGVLRQAATALEAARAAYQFGERGILEVLDAQRVLRSARTEYLTVEYDRQAALIELEQLLTRELRENRK